MGILVAYDGTKEAEEAARVALRHAKAFNENVLLVFSILGGPEISRQDFEQAEKKLESKKIDLEARGIACETILSVRGMEPGEDIVKIAKDKNAQEIIIGIQRRSKVGKLLFGSTAQYIILNAPCPVLSVR